MNLYTRRELLRLLAVSGTTGWAASHFGFLINDGREASPLMSARTRLQFYPTLKISVLSDLFLIIPAIVEVLARDAFCRNSVCQGG